MGDKVWFRQTIGDELLAGVIINQNYHYQVTTLEPAQRICLFLGPRPVPGRDVEDVCLHWNQQGELQASWADGQAIAAEHIKQQRQVIAKGSKYNYYTDSLATTDTTDWKLQGISYDVGIELSEAIDGWYWIVAPGTVKAQQKFTGISYRIRGQWGGLSSPGVDAVDKGDVGELYPNIKPERLLRR